MSVTTSTVRPTLATAGFFVYIWRTGKRTLQISERRGLQHWEKHTVAADVFRSAVSSTTDTWWRSALCYFKSASAKFCICSRTV